jgi:Uma2 family endonuclease
MADQQRGEKIHPPLKLELTRCQPTLRREVAQVVVFERVESGHGERDAVAVSGAHSTYRHAPTIHERSDVVLGARSVAGSARPSVPWSMRETSLLRTMTVEEYFQFEEGSEVRHEYVAGELYAMSGATLRHMAIVANIGTRLHGAAGDGPCWAVMNDIRVRVSHDVYYYPDVVVICAPMSQLDVTVTEPCVVIEVTSPSTARTDRGEKLTAYKEVTMLRAYLIVDHRRRRVERHWRNGTDGVWQREEIVLEGRVSIPCVDTDLTLDEIYRRVDLPAVGEPDEVEYEI